MNNMDDLEERVKTLEERVQALEEETHEVRELHRLNENLALSNDQAYMVDGPVRIVADPATLELGGVTHVICGICRKGIEDGDEGYIVLGKRKGDYGFNPMMMALCPDCYSDIINGFV